MATRWADYLTAGRREGISASFMRSAVVCLCLFGCTPPEEHAPATSASTVAAPPPSSAPSASARPKPPPPRPVGPPPPLRAGENAYLLKLASDTFEARIAAPKGWVEKKTETFAELGVAGRKRPVIRVEASCGGECTETNLRAVMAGWTETVVDAEAQPNRNAGDVKLEAVRLDVKLLVEGELSGGGRFAGVRVTKPAGLEGKYEERLAARCARPFVIDLPDRDEGGFNFYYVYATVFAALDDEDWDALLEACKSVNAVQP
jgi:hypothetical protein